MASFARQNMFRFAKTRTPLGASRVANSTGYRLYAGYSSLARSSNEGKSVIVTGSSRGIGKAIALRLAADGYDVCVNDLSANLAGCDEVVGEIQGMGRKACTAIADVSRRDEVRRMIQTSVNTLGPLNTMVANAGIAQVKPALELTEQDFERTFAINVFGVQNCFVEAAKQMIHQGNCEPDRPGKLVAAASAAAFRPFPMLSHYSASKHAIRGLTQAYAMELAEYHITANSYAPGVIGTTMFDQIYEEVAKRKGLPMSEVIDSIALRRFGTPEDVANLVSFLASSDSNFVTGQAHIVDGGCVYNYLA